MDLKARAKYLLDNFKLTLEQWKAIFDFQQGKCGICGCELIKANTDHCHSDKTGIAGEVRGLLCARCNRALGRFGDRIDLLLAAIAYLRFPPARSALGYVHVGYPGRIGTKKHRKMLKELRKNTP